VKVSAENYKDANKKIEKLVSSVEKGLKGKDCEFSVGEEK
jgi:hypothetical protein